MYSRYTCDFVRVKCREGGMYVMYNPEDAQRPRAIYVIHPDFRGIQLT